MVNPDHIFHIADYVIFGATIAISLGIGLYYALSGGKQRTTSEYFVGNRQMTIIPVAISLMVSFESSIMMLGTPAEYLEMRFESRHVRTLGTLIGMLSYGGLKAVIWTDVFHFDTDPTIRHTFWNLFVGSIIRGFGLVFNQSSIQRISSTPTIRDARK
ncbi:SC5A8-like protein [Mya arenaria]|uniref:SC5A8-like protein n=1 Tax=Mya arenaria TaxID=6604 RepID=A0ABY7G3R9_MYAAR|nr:SC5A8-like protein [Mya arenaria]